MFDLSKLSPAPWERCAANGGKCPCGLVWSRPADIPVAAPPDGVEMTDDVMIAHMDFVAVARNAFDVMLRLVCFPVPVEEGWSVWCVTPDKKMGSLFSVTRHTVPSSQWPRPWPDPLTALVEAGRWYAEHVEGNAANPPGGAG